MPDNGHRHGGENGFYGITTPVNKRGSQHRDQIHLTRNCLCAIFSKIIPDLASYAGYWQIA